jgi:hypothetical protein
MTIIVSVVLFLVLIVLAIGPPGFRKLVFVATTLCGLTAWYFIDKANNDAETIRIALAAAEHAAATRIKTNEVQLTVELTKMSFGGGYALKGNVTNNSKFGLSGMTVRVTVTDCVAANSCRVVGQEDATVSLKVPPGETSSFDSNPIIFKSLPLPALDRSTSYDLIGARSE